MKKKQKENYYNSNQKNSKKQIQVYMNGKKEKNIFGVVGFENNKKKNICFMNSSIQCFLQLKQFRDNILNINNEELNKLELTKEFRNLIIKIENNEINSNLYNMKKILSKVEEKYKTNEQCDANEFITIFLNQMLNELKGIEPLSNNNFPNYIKDQKMKKQFERLNKLFINKNNSFLIDLFYGKLIKEIYCINGHRISIKFQIYNIIELPIMEYINNDKNNKVELIDLLKEYQKEHNIDEEIECNECGKKVKCYSKTTIFNIPKYLILSLNQNIKFITKQKLNFEEIIHSKDFMNNKYNIDDKDDYYELISIIEYSGDRTNGHYIAKISDSINWYYISDSYIYEIEKDQLTSNFSYILFYGKKFLK